MVRPLTSRHLKSIVDTLRPYIKDAIILDLFAGTGRFGVAMLDNRAKHVTFVESHYYTYKKLLETLKEKENYSLFRMDVFKFLKNAISKRLRFDIVFADPPYNYWNEVFFERFFNSVISIIEKEAILLVKGPRNVIWTKTILSYKLWKTVVTGETTLNYYRVG